MIIIQSNPCHIPGVFSTILNCCLGGEKNLSVLIVLNERRKQNSYIHYPAYAICFRSSSNTRSSMFVL